LKTICRWILKHGKNPKHRSKDSIQKKYAKWISHWKAVYSGKEKGITYKLKQKAAQFGCPDLFETKDYEKEMALKVKSIFKWMRSNHDKKPSSHSKDSMEKKHGIILHSCRRSYINDKNRKLYDSLAKKFNHPDIFKTRDHKKDSEEKCKNLCIWMKNHNNKEPSQWSKDSMEKKHASWVSEKRYAYSGKRGYVYKEDLDMIKESGKSRRKKNTANGYSEWRNKSGITLSDLRGEDINKKEKNPKLKGLKEMIREGILNDREEIYLFYRDEKYTGRLTKEGKIETELGTFGIGQATLKMMHLNPGCESSLDTVNGYNCWRVWNGTKLKDLNRA
jgi:hypothetical protein